METTVILQLYETNQKLLKSILGASGETLESYLNKEGYSAADELNAQFDMTLPRTNLVVASDDLEKIALLCKYFGVTKCSNHKDELVFHPNLDINHTNVTAKPYPCDFLDSETYKLIMFNLYKRVHPSFLDSEYGCPENQSDYVRSSNALIQFKSGNDLITMYLLNSVFTTKGRVVSSLVSKTSISNIQKL